MPDPTPPAPSLGWRTDLFFARFDGEVIEHADHLCVRTPPNPTFWWGNFLLFRQAPRPGDLARWMALFDREIAALQPASTHRAFGVDTPGRPVLPPEFAEAGFLLDEASVLTLAPGGLRAPGRAWPDGIEWRVLDLRRDGDAVAAQRLASDDAGHEPAGHRVFVGRQVQRYAAMQRAGLGHWFGVFARVGGRAVLVGSCGLFRDGAGDDALGRFQSVSVHPAWRRRGLCTALVHAACRHGFEAMALRRLVMVADPADVAIGLYESLGFVRGERLWQLERPPR